MPLTRLLICAALSAIAAPAVADDGTVAVDWKAGVQSDYVLRGVSQTDSKPSIFGGVDVSWNHLYAGAWASNVDLKPFGDARTTAEVDLNAGLRATIATVNLDVGAQLFSYVNQPTGPKPQRTEFYVKASRPFGRVTVGLSAYKSPQFAYGKGSAFYYEANVAYAVDNKFTLSAAAGRQDIQRATDYEPWNVGATYALTDHLSLDGRYWNSRFPELGSPYKARFVVGLTARF